MTIWCRIGASLMLWAMLLTGAGPAAVPHAQAQSAQVVPAASPSVKLHAYDAATFAKQPLINGPQLSPDGKRVLFTTNKGGERFVIFRNLTDPTLYPVSIPEKLDLNWYRWAGNNRILISVSKIVYQFDEEVRKTYLIAVDTATMKPQFIGRDSQGLEGDDVLHVDPAGDYVLLSVQATPYEYPSVFRADLATGKLREIERPQHEIWEWYADLSGTVRYGMRFKFDKYTIFYRSQPGEKLKEVVKIADSVAVEQEPMGVDGLAAGTDQGYVFSSMEGKPIGLYSYNFATRTYGDRVYGQPEFDLETVAFDRNGQPVFAQYIDDRVRTHWFDPAQQAIEDAITKALGNRHGTLISTSEDGRVKIYLVGGPNDPGAFYVFDEAVGDLALLARNNETVKPTNLGLTQSIAYQSRDGYRITANLTLPPGISDPKGLPLIILPHGGPYGVRDWQRYDPEVQFLASRGYAVFQPNFRGSGGYGRAFVAAGFGTIGREMQDDLDDGMDHLAKQGIIDPGRVCVVGTSYGGYAALWAVTRNPDRYRCAASFAGVTDFKRILRYDSKFFTRNGNRRWAAKVRGDETFDLDLVSPVAQVAKLTRPVLVAQGGEDTTVPPKQARLYVEALKRSSKEHEYLYFDKEIHGWSDPDNFTQWLNRLEAFLTKHNPA